MQEVFYEESVSTADISKSKVKYYIMKVMSIIFLIIGVLATILFFYTVDVSVLGVVGIIFWAVVIIGSYTAGIIYLRKKDAFILDYDYTFVSGSVRISKVMNFKRRKQVISFNTSDIIQLGKYQSNSFEKIIKDTTNKKIIATPNETAAEGKDFYYIHFSTQGTKHIIVMECTETFMYNVLKFSSKTVLEPDFK